MILHNAAQPTVVFDTARNQTVLNYVQLSPGANFQVVSHDFGQTWSKPRTWRIVVAHFPTIRASKRVVLLPPPLVCSQANCVCMFARAENLDTFLGSIVTSDVGPGVGLELKLVGHKARVCVCV